MTSTSLKDPVAAPTGANAEKEAQLHASLGQLLLRQERYAQAVNELTAALEAKPDQPAWLASRAEANEHLGAVYKAVDDAAAAVMAEPNNAEHAALLARLLQRAGRHDESVLSWSEAIRLDETKVEYYEGLARALWIKGSLASAIELFDKLRQADPTNESYYLTLAEIYMQDQQPAKAAEICQAAIDKGLKSALIDRAHGHAKLVLGDRSKAADLFRTGLEQAPKDGYLLHMLSIVGNEPSTRAPDDYVRAVFDTRADSYETAALFKLGIRSPGLMRRELLRIRPKLDPSRPGAHKLSAVLDLGCGTGLVGALMYDMTAYMKGVDLSRNMVRYAQIKGIYHELEVAELTASMNSDPRLYECITAGDVVSYFGDLKPVFEAAFKRLLPSGLFLLSLEGGTEAWRADVVAGVSKDQWKLQDTGRYCHALPYVEACAKAAGFEIVQVWPETLQTENDVDLHGYVISLRRPLS